VAAPKAACNVSVGQVALAFGVSKAGGCSNIHQPNFYSLLAERSIEARTTTENLNPIDNLLDATF
jgi:hypothetical protein